MERYYLTKFGNLYMKDRTRIFADPCLYLSDTNFTEEQVQDASLEPDDITLTREYPVHCLQMHNDLVFIFDVDESAFVAGNKSLVIGFKREFSRTPENGFREDYIVNRTQDLRTSNFRQYMVIKGSLGEFSRLIYVNNDNLFGGYLENDPSVNVTELRMRYGQLQHGRNSIIIRDVFSCVVLPDEVIDNQTTSDSVSQLKTLYPYYEKI